MSKSKTLSPARKRALRAKRRRTAFTVIASVPAVVYVAYRVYIFVHTM